MNIDLCNLPEDAGRFPYCRKQFCNTYNGHAFAVRHVVCTLAISRGLVLLCAKLHSLHPRHMDTSIPVYFNDIF